MKKIRALLVITPFTLAMFLSIPPVDGQDVFEFYVAFEDATEARDTVWFVMHSEGTWNVDSNLGEVLSPINDGNFNAWINDNTISNDAYKKVVFPFEGAFGGNMSCNNYLLPITLTYDSSLFESSLLYDVLGYGVEYARLENQFLTPPDDPEAFNMLENNMCELPVFNFGDGNHFPLHITVYCGNVLSVRTTNRLSFQVFPNPSSQSTTIQSSDIIQEFILRNNVGMMIRRLQPFSERVELNLNGIAAGIYLVEVITEEGSGVQKLVVE